MTSFDELYDKYAASSPIRPPKPKKDVSITIPKLDKLPDIKDLTEEEMIDWEEQIAKQNLPKSLEDLEITKELTDLGKEEKAQGEEGTLPAVPKKKANLSPDTLLKMCSRYHDLCHKF